MKLTRAQRDILWSDFRADDSGRATAPELTRSRCECEPGE